MAQALQAGLDQSSPAARLGMLESYGPEIEALGLGGPVNSDEGAPRAPPSRP